MGGSGYSALIGRTMVRDNDLPRDDDGHCDPADDPPPISEVLVDANRALADTPKMYPFPQDVLIDGISCFSLSRQYPWDCKSVLTT